MARPTMANLLRRVASGERLSPDEENILRDLASRSIVLPNSITDSSGTRMAVSREQEDPLVWAMLMENHPGNDICFDIIIGEWNSETNTWEFDCQTTAGDYEVGIDFHYGAPFPDIYACGWFKRMPSGTTDSGNIYHVVSLDCTSRGSCANLTTTGC